MAEVVKVKVTNKDSSYVGYYIPEMNIKRTFSSGETKDLSHEELRALCWTKGGKNIVKNHLIIEDPVLLRELLGEVEPEYFYTSKDIEQLLLYGSEDQLKDALDFGYEGTTILIKEKAVELKLNDLRKRQIILEKTGFNVTNSIEVNEASNVVEEAPKMRRAAPLGQAADNGEGDAPQRRAAAPKFKLANS